MKMVAINVDVTLLNSQIVITHNDEEIFWNIKSFEKDSFTKFDMFEHINNYWSRFSMADQDKIFLVYKEIRQVFEDIWDRDKLTTALYVLVARLLDMHNLDDAHHWIMFHSNTYFPDTLEVEYVTSNDRPGSREQTYLKQDYTKLVALTLVLRTMIPIWGEFISRTKHEAGTIFKEYYAYQLICQSQLAHSEPISKLTTYIEYSIIPDKSKSAAIIGGISTEDFPIWILGLVLVRRLCVGDIRGVEPKATLITFIYKFITQKIKGSDNSFEGMVKDKIFEESSSDGDANISKLEGYKAKQEIPSGDIVLLEYAMRDLDPLALKLAPSMDLALLYTALETSQILNKNIILDSQVTLLQWVLKPVLSTRGIMFLSKATIVRALALCQAVLWHRGHYALAALSTAVINQNHDEIQISGVDSRARIPKEMLEEFAKYYPFTKRIGSKQKISKPINQAVASIDSMAELLSSQDWVFTIDEKLLPLITEGSTSRRYSIPHNIKIILATLALELARRDWKR